MRKTDPTSVTPTIGAASASAAASRPYASPGSAASKHQWGTAASSDAPAVYASSPSTLAHADGGASSSGAATSGSTLRYSREFLLDLFDPGLPPPKDFDPVPLFTVSTPLEPVTNLPLTEIERRVVASQSVNPDATRRGGSRDDHRDRGGDRGGDRGAERGGDRGGDGRRGQRPPALQAGRRFDGTPGGPRSSGVDKAPLNSPWTRGKDSKTFFDGDVEKDEGNAEARSITKEPLRGEPNSEDDPSAEGPAPESVVGSTLSQAPGGKQSPTAIGTTPVGGGSLSLNNGSQIRGSNPVDAQFAGIFNQIGHGGVPDSIGLDQFGITPNDRSNPVSSLLGLDSHALRTSSSHERLPFQSQLQHPLSSIVHSQPKAPITWFYLDPSGVLQGPFPTHQMQEWFELSYFSDDLPIRRNCDVSFQSLAYYKATFGSLRMFFIAEDPELARMEQSRHVPLNPLRSGFGMESGLGVGFGGGYRPLDTRYAAVPEVFGTPTKTGGLGGIQFGTTHLLSNQFGSLNDSRPSWGSLAGDPANPAGFGRISETISGGVPVRHQSSSSASGALFQNNMLGSGLLPANPINQGPSFLSSHDQQLGALGFNYGVANVAPQTDARQNWGADQLVIDDHQYQLQNASQQHQSHQTEPDQHSADSNSRLGDIVSELVDESSLLKLIGDPIEPVQSEIENLKLEEYGQNEGQEQHPHPEEAKADTSKLQSPTAEDSRPEDSDATKTQQPAPVEPAAPLPQASSTVSKAKKAKAKKAAAAAAAAAVNAAQGERQQNTLTDIAVSPDGAAKPPPTPAWTTEGAAPKPSLKEIQMAEAKEREAREKEKAKKAHQQLMAQAQALAEQEAAAAANAGNFSGSSGLAWTASTASPKKDKSTLAAIMQEEETRRKKQEAAAAAVAAAAAASSAAAAAAAGRRYAETAATTSSSPWVAAAAANVVSKGAPGLVVKPVVVAAASAAKPAAASPPPSSGGAWSVVGKPPAPAVQPIPVPVVVSPVKPAPPKPVSVHMQTKAPQPQLRGPKESGVSDTFLQWCRQALRPLEKSTTAAVKVDEFIQILLMMPVSEPQTTYSICDDTLGGLTAIDPRKFADEFIRRRKSDSGDGSSVGSTGGRGAAAASSGLSQFESNNSFVVVGGGKNKKKR